MVRGVGFEPTNLCRIGASGLRLWPCWATPALTIAEYMLLGQEKVRCGGCLPCPVYVRNG